MGLNGLTASTLADVCSLVTDGTHDTPTQVASGYPLIKAKEITGGQLDFETCDQISEKEHLEVIARSKPEFGDTLFAHIGASLGEAAFVNITREFSIKNVALFKPNPAFIDARYLYYLVISPAFQALAKRTKTGSAQPFLGLSQLRGHRIQYHRDLSTQRRIGGILSSYDELMENSQRRIRILEAMARALYREWFIHFRFPGHEDLPLVSSRLGNMPEGWGVRKLADVAEVNRAQINARTLTDDLHYIDISSVSPGRDRHHCKLRFCRRSGSCAAHRTARRCSLVVRPPEPSLPCASDAPGTKHHSLHRFCRAHGNEGTVYVPLLRHHHRRFRRPPHQQRHRLSISRRHRRDL